MGLMSIPRPAFSGMRCVSAVTLLTLAIPASVHAADQTAIWDGSDGNWTDAQHWSTALYPDNSPTSFDAAIAVGTVELNSDITIENLLLNGPDGLVHHTAGVFTAQAGIDLSDGQYLLDGGTISNTTIRPTGGDLLFSGRYSVLDNVILDGNLVMDEIGSRLTLRNGAMFTGDAQLTAKSADLLIATDTTFDNTTINLDGRGAALVLVYRQNATLTFGPGATVNLRGRGAGIAGEVGPEGTVVNRGLIVADNPDPGTRTVHWVEGELVENHGTMEVRGEGAELWLSGDTVVNYGSIIAAPGTVVSLAGAWDNDGSITLDTSALLTLRGTFSTDDIGTIVRNGGSIEVDGVWDNSGNNFALDETTGDVRIGGTIIGGSLTPTTRTASFGRVTLDGMAFNGDLIVDEDDAYVTLRNGTQIAGDMEFNGMGADLLIDDAVTLEDKTITMSGRDSGFWGTHVVLGTGTTLHLGGPDTRVLVAENRGRIVVEQGTDLNLIKWEVLIRSEGVFENHGQIIVRDEVELEIVGEPVVNHGLIEALPGSTIKFDRIDRNNPGIQNEAGGVIRATGASVRMLGEWDNDGQIILVDSDLYLHGIFETEDIGMIDRTRSQIIVAGYWNLGGEAFSLNASTGDYFLRSGKIIGGEIHQDGGRLLIDSGTNNALDAVVCHGDLVMDQAGGDLVLQNGAAFTGDARLDANYTRLVVAQDMTIDKAVIELNGKNSGFGIRGSRTLTIGPDATVNLNRDYTAICRDMGGSGDSTLINEGRIVTWNHTEFYHAGASIYADTLKNRGAIIAEDRTRLGIRTSTAFHNTGMLLARADSRISVSGWGTSFDTGSQLGVEAGGEIFRPNAPIILPTGTRVFGSGLFNSPIVTGGLIEPGNDGAGELRIAEGLTMEPTSELAIEIGGDLAGESFDVTNVLSGTATLDGHLIVDLVGSFIPDPASTFDILHAPTIVGQFANAPDGSTVQLDNGVRFEIHYFADRVQITNVIPEPSSTALLAFGGLILLRRSAWRRGCEASRCPGR